MLSTTRRTTLAVAATTALALSATPSLAVASPAPEEKPLGTYVFRFTFDKGESLNPGTRVRDVTGHGNYGVVRVSGQGRLKVDEGINGRGADYPGSCKKCGKAIIEVAHGKGMNPRARAFSFGAAIKVGDRQAKPGREPNIIQKGYIGQRQWKLELIGAKPRCVVRGGLGIAKAVSAEPVDDGTWHRLECRRVGMTVTLRVDGTPMGTFTGPIGSIKNPYPVTVGGKAVGRAGGDDQYHGDLDNAFYTIKTGS